MPCDRGAFYICDRGMIMEKRLSDRIFNFLEVHLPAFVFMLLVITVSVQVFSRYVLDHPLPKFFELSIYTFVWSIYLGAALAKRYGKHIRFDILYEKFSVKTRRVIDIFFDLLTNAALLILLIPSVRYTIWNYRVKASALRVPWTYLLLCFPIFVLLILIHNTTAIVRNIRDFSETEIRTEEDLPWL
jgi:TRAP-type C4-dicarboxylate transport system permease small subunit